MNLNSCNAGRRICLFGICNFRIRVAAALRGWSKLYADLSAETIARGAEQFKRALVFLRRAFGVFSPREKRQICENLAHLWGLDEEKAFDEVVKPLSDEEEKSLKDLNEMDFGDL